MSAARPERRPLGGRVERAVVDEHGVSDGAVDALVRHLLELRKRGVLDESTLTPAQREQLADLMERERVAAEHLPARS